MEIRRGIVGSGDKKGGSGLWRSEGIVGCGDQKGGSGLWTSEYWVVAVNPRHDQFFSWEILVSLASGEP